MRQVPADAPGRNSLLAWFGGATLFFVTLVFPIQFDRQWITVGWALEGMALLWLFHRIPHQGLRLTGFGLLTVAFVRLALNPAVLTYHARGDLPILNWYLYAYGVVIVLGSISSIGGGIAVRDYPARAQVVRTAPVASSSVAAASLRRALGFDGMRIDRPIDKGRARLILCRSLCGCSSMVEQKPSKLPHVGSIPITRSTSTSARIHEAQPATIPQLRHPQILTCHHSFQRALPNPHSSHLTRASATRGPGVPKSTSHIQSCSFLLPILSSRQSV